MKAHGSLGSSEYGTPVWLVEAIRQLMGEIDLDPFSSEAHNRTVRAKRFFSKKQNAFDCSWLCETMLVNPPGGGRRLGQAAWKRLVFEHQTGQVGQAVFVAFSVDYLSTTQSASSVCMLDFPCLVFGRRFGYLTTKEDAVEQASAKALANEPRGAELLRQLRAFDADSSLQAVEAGSPPRPSCLCWLPPLAFLPERAVHLFRLWAQKLPFRGKVIA